MQQSIRTEDAPGSIFTWWSGTQLETLVKEGLVEDMTDFWDEYVNSQWRIRRCSRFFDL